MTSTLDLIDACEAAYRGPWQWENGHVRAILTKIGGQSVIAFQGTVLDGWDIVRDIRFIPWWHHRVGFGPAGFLKGLSRVMDQMIFDLSDEAREGRLEITGHSLGAAMAEECAGWWVSLGAPPARLLSVAPPRAGGFKLRRLVQSLGDRQEGLHCGNDIVPDIPFPYLHASTVRRIGVPTLNPLHSHRLASYREAASILVGKELATP